MFRDRTDAAMQLAEKLEKFRGQDMVILAIPKGGLPLGNILAKSLNAPLDVALSKKIGHPYNREYAIGAVSLKNLVLTKGISVSKDYIAQNVENIRNALKKSHEQYHKNRKPISLEGKTVIIVDDGVATGNTIKVTAQLVHDQHPKKTIVAIPVAPPGAVQNLQDSNFVDDVICLEIPPNFYAVGQFYEEFNQVTEKEAIQLLEQANNIDRPT